LIILVVFAIRFRPGVRTRPRSESVFFRNPRAASNIAKADIVPVHQGELPLPICPA
jgi:hypothetical protein